MRQPRLAYDDRGEGDVVVLVHGHPFDRTLWAPQLAGLTSDLRVLAPDLPGYGQSPVRAGTVAMRELADAVLELLDALEVDRSTIVGLSMGGLVAMELALARPERVHGVVLAATTAAAVTDGEIDARRSAAAGIEDDGMLDVALQMLPSLFGAGARRDPELVSRIFSMMMHTPPVGAAAAVRGRAERPDYAALLPALRVPALVIAGDSDGYAPEPVVSELIAALPDPEVLRLPGVGHLPNLEAPEQFNAVVRRFVRDAVARTP